MIKLNPSLMSVETSIEEFILYNFMYVSMVCLTRFSHIKLGLEQTQYLQDYREQNRSIRPEKSNSGPLICFIFEFSR